MNERTRLPIALLLARLRAEMRLSQADLAERVNGISGGNLTRWDISRYERGGRIPTVHLPALAIALGAELSMLEEAASITRAVRRGEVSAVIGKGDHRERTPDDNDRLIRSARRPSRVDAAVVADLSGTLAGQRRIEDMIGSAAIIEPAGEQLKLTVRILREARGSLADDLAATASEASQFNGWLHTATGHHDAAGALYDQALRLGIQAGKEDLAATALSMQGHLAWVTGDIGSMAALSEAAARTATATGTRTVAIQQRGRALAIMGDKKSAIEAIGEAEEVLAGRTSGDDPDSLYFYGPEYLRMQRGLILSYLADGSTASIRAADTISDAIEALAPAVRDSEWVAWYRVRAAAAFAAGGEPDAASAGLRHAHAIVSVTGGTRTLGEIARVHARMAAKWPTHPCVVEVGEQIAG
ncbi:helix-turn-helix domain-containing protein [Actinoallomurus rhizosphaericola]|uniref:helix-turn-helix domain-containing protein n=1 Tax=Actinoallomurus rhizosphaericola TaxID=2952536 RepID=UPI002093EB23|nr:helix-turn-helix transcriptional regulator [Actinoallomurus rhizosphaericola]MCO5994857.1 helix-turn-helix transcriptional regulator [Actinoallomurus rhizosphaericola]